MRELTGTRVVSGGTGARAAGDHHGDGGGGGERDRVHHRQGRAADQRAGADEQLPHHQGPRLPRGHHLGRPLLPRQGQSRSSHALLVWSAVRRRAGGGWWVWWVWCPVRRVMARRRRRVTGVCARVQAKALLQYTLESLREQREKEKMISDLSGELRNLG
eukprot:2423030-Rhodomonas_salina.1